MSGILNLGVAWAMCANRETHEFWLTLDGNRIGAVGTFRPVRGYETPEQYRLLVHREAAAALQTLLVRESRNAAS